MRLQAACDHPSPTHQGFVVHSLQFVALLGTVDGVCMRAVCAYVCVCLLRALASDLERP